MTQSSETGSASPGEIRVSTQLTSTPSLLATSPSERPSRLRRSTSSAVQTSPRSSKPFHLLSRVRGIISCSTGSLLAFPEACSLKPEACERLRSQEDERDERDVGEDVYEPTVRVHPVTHLRRQTLRAPAEQQV